MSTQFSLHIPAPLFIGGALATSPVTGERVGQVSMGFWGDLENFHFGRKWLWKACFQKGAIRGDLHFSLQSCLQSPKMQHRAGPSSSFSQHLRASLVVRACSVVGVVSGAAHAWPLVV